MDIISILLGSGGGLLLGLMAAVGFSAVMKKMYPYDVTIYESREGAIQVIKDVGAVRKDEEGVVWLKLKNEKDSIKPPKYENLPKASGGSRAVINLYSPNRGEYFEMAFKPEKKQTFDIVPDDNKLWFVLAQREKDRRFKKQNKWLDMLKTAAPLIMVALVGVIMVVMLMKGAEYYSGLNAQMAVSNQAYMDHMDHLTAAILGLYNKTAAQEILSDVPDDVTPPPINIVPPGIIPGT